MLDQFQKFLEDKEAPEMFITGVAGTGKTTSLKHLLEWCGDNTINAVVCAYTHKACGVLRDKLPNWVTIQTLHSFLVKRPTININATQVKHLEGNTQMGDPDRVRLVFIDEFSMVGERDYVDLKAMQYDGEGNLLTKIIFIGDPNQLPPVKDVIVVIPKEPYWVKLTQIHRQAGDNQLIENLLALNDYINGAKPEPLQEHENLIRRVDLIERYKECRTSKVLLAYTNEKVEALNAQVQGREIPEINDRLFSPTTRQFYLLEDIQAFSDEIIKINGEILEVNSKYRTLETLHEIDDIKFFRVINEDGVQSTRAVIFGHDQFNKYNQLLGKNAAYSNRLIEKVSNGESAKAWAFKNWSHPLAKKRKEAWKHYLAFKDCVVCMDFEHAMTVHKSQGSTYENVFLDTEDIGRCADHDFELYLKLMYVGISRASKNVYTN